MRIINVKNNKQVDNTKAISKQVPTYLIKHLHTSFDLIPTYLISFNNVAFSK